VPAVNNSSSQPATAASAQLSYRYPGPNSFEDTEVDRHRFFGRDKERNEIVNKVLSVNLLVLFGKSGLGKTSLLKAGVYPRLRERKMLPLLVRVNRHDATPVTIVTEAIEEACKAQGIEFTHGDRSGLWEYFKTTVFWHDNALWTPVLVLDQFEEIFTLQDADARRAIARELGELVGGGLPERIRLRKRALRERGVSLGFSDAPPEVKLIVSLREEYVGTLQEIFPEVPSILSNRVRLAPLAREQAEEAVTKPPLSEGAYRTRPFTYAENALNELLDFLAAKNGQIEPFQLQVLCSHVEQRVEREQSALAADTPRIDVGSGYLGGSRGMKDILKNFYRQAIKTLPGIWTRRRARKLCEFGLLTQEGFRESLGERRIIEEYKLDTEDLETLVNARLLRKEPQHDSFTYELTHDSLTGPVKASRPLRVPRLLIIAIVAFVMIAVAGYSYEANEARLAASEARLAAEEAKRLAEIAQQIERVKETTRKAAQVEVNKLLQENTKLASQFNALQDSNRKKIEKLQQRMAEQKAGSDQAVATAQDVIYDLQAQLEVQQDQAEQVVDKTTQEFNRAEEQRKKLEITLAEYTARLAEQKEAAAILEKQLTQKVEELENAAQTNTQSAPSILIPEMVRIQAGSFLMGSVKKLDLDAENYEFPRHNVTIGRVFEIGKYEVTFEEYDTFALATGIEPPDDEGWGRGRRPVINVSWDDARAYAGWLSEQTGMWFRLPTESEWEYAARAGSETRYLWGDEIGHENANYGKNKCCGGLAQGRDEWRFTAPIGQFDANPFGLFDMHGNVWEWVEDCYTENYNKATKDGSALAFKKCPVRVLRGGAWVNVPRSLRSATRSKGKPYLRNYVVGFRLARSL
jgi:formylglycine-generating enzyme required for sulfatase activity